MKKVIVACGNGVATSQTVAFRINRMLEKENITNVRVEAVNLRSYKESFMELLPISILQIVIWIMEFLLLTDLLFSQESIKKKRFKNLSKS